MPWTQYFQLLSAVLVGFGLIVALVWLGSSIYYKGMRGHAPGVSLPKWSSTRNEKDNGRAEQVARFPAV